MPITKSSGVSIEYKLLPITLQPDGSSVVYLREFLIEAGKPPRQVSMIEHVFDATQTQGLLAQQPTPGVSRLDDLTAAIYQALIDAGVASGDIS